MKVLVVFEDWKKEGRSIYNTETGINLSTGSLHSGSTWEGTIDFDPDTELEIKERGKYRIIFEIIPSEEIKMVELKPTGKGGAK